MSEQTTRPEKLSDLDPDDKYHVIRIKQMVTAFGGIILQENMYARRNGGDVANPAAVVEGLMQGMTDVILATLESAGVPKQKQDEVVADIVNGFPNLYKQRYDHFQRNKDIFDAMSKMGNKVDGHA